MRYCYEATLTLPSYPEKHRHADEVHKLETGIDGEQGIPEKQQLIKREFAPEEEPYPASIPSG